MANTGNHFMAEGRLFRLTDCSTAAVYSVTAGTCSAALVQIQICLLHLINSNMQVYLRISATIQCNRNANISSIFQHHDVFLILFITFNYQKNR